MDTLELLVSGDRVYCPRRKRDVDVEGCLTCDRLYDVRRWRDEILTISCKRPWDTYRIAADPRYVRLLED